MKILKYIAFSLLILPLSVGLWACDDDDPSGESIFIIDQSEDWNPFDEWLDENYRAAYNIMVKYKYADIESDLTFNLIPARIDESIKLTKIIKYLWLDPYAEVAGLDFVRKYVPRVMHLVGTAGWESNGTMRLGTAEGGLKITMYLTNWLDETNIPAMNEYYLNTIHHEFGHILHQTIMYPMEFNTISVSDYLPSSWFNRSEVNANKAGFVSQYAGNQEVDDFVETLARYLTRSETEWNRMLSNAGTEGTAKINQKLNIVKTYMDESWGIDLDELREVLQRRYEELPLLDLTIEGMDYNKPVQPVEE